MAETEKQMNSKFKEFFKGLKAEFRRIVWPTKEDLARQTVAVVITSIILGLIIAFLDWAFQLGFGAILK